MISTASLSAKDRLRRTRSTRSMRRRTPSSHSEPFDPELAKTYAAAAASRAMHRSEERSSMESKRSYDRLGGPSNVAVPQRRRPGSGISCDEDAVVIDSSSSRPSVRAYGDAIESECSAALPPINEFGGLDGRKSSLPSSYRRLRKAKSMFSTRQRTNIGHGISSESYGSTAGDREAVEAPRVHRTLRRSMSFLRGGQPSKSAQQAKSQEAAIQLARSQFLQSPRSPEIDTQSPLYNAKTRRDPKPFRKTFRESSESGYDTMGSPSWDGQSKTSSRQSKARSISLSSIKKGLKRVLGLSKPSGEQTETSETPQSRYSRSSTASATDTDYAPDENNVESPTGYPGLSRPSTIRSVQSSESLATSRVTSWADSTAANTITNRRTGERNPLSIIEEHGNADEQMPINSPTRGPLRPDGTIDSQRLYSALMKHMHPEEELSIGHVKEHHLVPEHASSVYSRRPRQVLRHAPSDGSMASPRSFATANAGTFSPQKQSQRPPRSTAPSQGPGSFRLRHQDNPYVTGSPFDKDSDSDSVIVSRQNEQESIAPDSPSVYSRTTSGYSPVKKAPEEQYESEEEPGTVTIFASQRTTYSSPKRIARSSSGRVPSRPSAEWQQWMQSQMARIETDVPSREHYRENAQIHSDESGPLHLPTSEETQRNSTSIVDLDTIHEFPRSVEVSNSKLTAQNNFSRPFSRSSSLRTIHPSQKDHGSTAVPSAIPMMSTLSNNHNSPSPMRARSGNMDRIPDSPTPKREFTNAQRRKMADAQNRRYSIRRLPTAQDPKAAQIRDRRENRGLTNENVRADEGHMWDQYDKLQDIHSTISSKRMVEMFLDSRRQQTDREVSEGAFI